MKIRKEQKNETGRACSWVRLHWAVVLAALFVLAAGLIYGLAGEKNAQIAVADNLDLFQAQYQMLKNTGTFFGRDSSAPFLHGISRNVLPSEFSLEAMFYMILPSYWAYVVMYLAKVLLGTISFVLLAGEIEKRGLADSNGSCICGLNGIRLSEKEAGKTPQQYAVFNLAVLSGLAYGCLNLFPSFGISFASIPLMIWLLLRLWNAQSRKGAIGWLLLIFCYPWVSYFSYFGIFLLGYMAIAVIWLLVRAAVSMRQESGSSADSWRKVLRLFAALLVLALGYAVWEHRLFAQMLFGTETTIRETMVQTSLSAEEILEWIRKLLQNGVDLHCESAHRSLVLPVCLLFFLAMNLHYVRKGQWKRCTGELFNLGALILIFNSVVYGLYYCESFRNLVEKLLPPLKGFQFSRTAFFNPFVWYGMFYLALRRCMLRGVCWRRGSEEENSAGCRGIDAAKMDSDHIAKRAVECGASVSARKLRSSRVASIAVYGLALAAILAVLGYGNTYNDLQHTAKALVKQVLGREPDNTLSYGEFYSTDLFEKACEEIGYDGEWAAAYGFHPAVLEYNRIATIDGYLGFYSEEYKENFRKVIAPALEQNESSRIYYDEWGARCYLYSADNATVVEAVRNYTHEEDTLAIDADALRELDCRYIFSRIHITNAEKLGLTLRCSCTDESSPYKLYVYEMGVSE